MTGILIVSSDQKERETLKDIITKHIPDSEISVYGSSPRALAFARTHTIHVAFLDMQLTEIDALNLGEYLKDLHPSINLIFLTEKKSDAYEALIRRASGCLLHSFTQEDILRELNDLRHPVKQNHPNRAFARTFGSFEFFVDGAPITFRYSRTKEVLAILVNNRGAQTSNGEIISNLWEDEGDPEKKGSYLRNLRQDLNNTLSRLKLNDIILKQRGSMAIVTDRIECDLYDWLEKKQESVFRYTGEYMSQYSWSEYYIGNLEEISSSFLQ